MTDPPGFGNIASVMRAIRLLFVVGTLLGLGCTGRTPPASLPRSTASNVVDAGGVADSGVVDSGSDDELYSACQSLASCPAGTVRCTIDHAGVCNPPCDAQGMCPSIGGKEGICVGDGSVEWCVLPCGEDPDCPDTFVCSSGGTCVRT